jgi:hypothetical protein
LLIATRHSIIVILETSEVTMATVRKREWVSGGKTREAWLACYVDQQGKRRFKTFATKKAADQWMV